MRDLSSTDWSYLSRHLTGNNYLESWQRATNPQNLNPNERHKWITLKRGWLSLIKEVELAIQNGDQPDSETGRQLASRWRGLRNIFSAGNPQIVRHWENLYQNRNQLSQDQARFLPSQEVLDFIRGART